MKNYHKYGLINPDRVYQACKYLISHHPDYKNIKLACYQDWAKNCPTLFNQTDESDSEENEDTSEEETADESGKKKLDQKKRVHGEADGNDSNATTCLYPREPASSMIINHSNEKKNIKFKRKDKKMCMSTPRVKDKFQPIG